MRHVVGTTSNASLRFSCDSFDADKRRLEEQLAAVLSALQCEKASARDAAADHMSAIVGQSDSVAKLQAALATAEQKLVKLEDKHRLATASWEQVKAVKASEIESLVADLNGFDDVHV